MTLMETPDTTARVTADDAELVAQVDRLFARWDSGDGTGACVAVVRAGEPVLERAYGMADLEHGVAMTSDTVFDIASMSKQFTAAAILLLADAGEIDLDDEIQAYLPEIPEYDTAITVRHLVHHTGGLRDYIALRMLAGFHDSDYFDMQDVLDLVSRQRGVNFPAGSKHMYSNSGYVLLAVIVSRVTGVSFDEHCRRTFFEPLGMTASRFREDVTRIVPGLAQSYRRTNEGELRKTIPDDDVVGDGGLLSSLHDLVRWERNFVQGTVGGAAFADRMATVGTPPDDEERYAYGLSVGEHRGLRTVSHGGNLHGFAGELLRFPEETLTVICMGNCGTFDASGLARKVAAVYLADRLSGEPASTDAADGDRRADGRPPLSAAELERFAGHYRQADTGLVIDVVLEDDGLVAGVADTRIPMRHRQDATFSGDYHDLSLPVEFTPTDHPTELRVLHEGTAIITAVRVEPPALAASELAAYTGEYWSDELAVRARVVLEGDRLFLLRGSGSRIELRPMLVDEFATPFGGATFLRSDAGDVTAFALSMSRSMGARFERTG